MTAVIWGDGVEVNSAENGAIAKTHQEYTINSWDELKDIDTSYCLQGSVVYNIKEPKFAVWDGEAHWFDTSGNQYPQDPPVAYWVMDSNWRNPNTYDLPVTDGDSFEMEHAPQLYCFAGSIDGEYFWPLDIVSSDESVMAPDNGRIFFFKAGTADITATIPTFPDADPDEWYYPYLGQSITFTITCFGEDTPGG